MKNIKSLILITMLFVYVSGPVQAEPYGLCSNCTVVSVGSGPHYDSACVQSTSCAAVAVRGATLARADCNSITSWNFVFDTSTDSGKSTLSLLLTAMTTGKPVVIEGAGTCNNAAKIEDLRYIYFSADF